MIFVFLGKKLISLDTILPVIAEVRSYNSKQSGLIAPDKKHKTKSKNITLYHFICLIVTHQVGWAKTLDF